MKLNFLCDKDLLCTLSRLSELIGFDIGEGGIPVSFVKGERLGASLSDGKAAIYYQRKHQIFRELCVLLENAKASDSFDVTEDGFFEPPAIMLDASRGAVANLSGVYRFLDYAALMGFGAVMLYTEDTAELEGYPYFGYMRGRYTRKELRKIDDYAYGIEMIPCIECYGHMGKYLLWGEALAIKDTNEVLLAREEKTFEFLDKWIGAISSCFRSGKIHVGMDEAWDMGRGAFLDKHGYVPPFEIFCEYMDRLVEITDKYGLEPLMWSDMYFRISSKDGKEYYDEETVVPDWVRDRIPKNVTLVYWHYGRLSGIDGYMLKKHKELGRRVAYAGGLWGWSGHLPEHGLSMRGAKAALRACREQDVRLAMTTIWSNDNAECDLFAQLVGLSYFAEHVYDPEPSEEKIKKRFLATTGADFDAFHKMGDYHNVFDGREYKSFQHRFFGKLLFWQDVLEGTYDAELMKNPMSSHYAECRDYFEKLKNDARWSELYTHVYNIFNYLALKTYVAENLVTAYKANDREMLQKITYTLLPELIEKTKAVHASHKARWFSYNKAVGWSNLDIRYAGVKERCATAIDRLSAYLRGECDSVEELEVERLPRAISAFTKYGAIASPMGSV